MNVALNEYGHLKSLLHRWQPTYKLFGLVSLIFAFALVEDLRLLPAMLGVTAALYRLSQLPLSFLLRRLSYPSCFILGVVVLLPLFSGETVIWQWGPISLRQEGSLAVLLILCRFLSILTIGLLLLETSPFWTTVKAMRSLGLPPILADMMLLTYRYLYEVSATLETMKRAMHLRGFQHQPRSVPLPLLDLRMFRRLAALAGTLLVRSYEQSERIYKAMCLRGYGTPQSGPWASYSSTPHHKIKRFKQLWDLTALVFTLLVSVSFVALNLLWT